MQLVFAPTDVGVPTARARKYTTAFRLAQFFPLPREMGAEKLFQKLFCHPPIASAQMYLQATAMDLAGLKRKMAETKQCVADDAVIGKMSFASLLRGAERQRLLAYREAYQLAVSKDEGRKLDAAFVDLAQNVRYMSRITDACPALLRHSCLYDLIADRPVLPGEAFVAMGFPVMVCDSPASDDENELLQDLHDHYWPWQSWSMGDLPPTATRLLGNGMHMHAIGLCELLSSRS